ncbi:hypothetical protein BH09ACT6_BH09ACT6_05820 [soil metagenome]
MAVLGRHPAVDEEIEAFFDAEIIPEPDNPYDRDAISIRIHGQVVGYLPKGEFSEYLPILNCIAANGVVAVTTARIWAVTRQTRRSTTPEFFANIRVSLPDANIFVPSSQPPSAPYTIIPWGSKVQVTGEDKHFDVLSDFVPREGEKLLLVTLHRDDVVNSRGTVKSVVEVRLEGDTIGELSTTTSKNVLPIIDYLDRESLMTAAWATIRGSSLTAEVVVYVVKASEISDDALDSAVTIPHIDWSKNVAPPAHIPDPQPTPELPSAAHLDGYILAIVFVVAVVLVFAIPGYGLLLGVALVAGIIFFNRWYRRQPPR